MSVRLRATVGRHPAGGARADGRRRRAGGDPGAGTSRAPTTTSPGRGSPTSPAWPPPGTCRGCCGRSATTRWPRWWPTTARVLARSPNILRAPRIAGFRPGTTPVVRTVRGPDDQETEDYRLWGQRAGTPDGPVTVYVGSSLESAQEVTGRLTRLLLLGLPLVLALLAGAIWLVIGTDAASGRADPGRGRRDLRARPGPAGAPARHRRRGAAAGRDHEPDARPARERRAPPARLRGQRLARPAEPADR